MVEKQVQYDDICPGRRVSGTHERYHQLLEAPKGEAELDAITQPWAQTRNSSCWWLGLQKWFGNNSQIWPLVEVPAWWISCPDKAKTKTVIAITSELRVPKFQIIWIFISGYPNTKWELIQLGINSACSLRAWSFLFIWRAEKQK